MEFINLKLINMLKVYINFKFSHGISGGANSFLRNLVTELEKRGISFVDKLNNADLIFLNATSIGDISGNDSFLTKKVVKELYKTKLKRKVAYMVTTQEY